MSVFANGRSMVHKGDGVVNVSATPDVCKTPSPGGPVPVPYPNFAKDADLTAGTATVEIDGNSVAIEGASLSRSSGDEAGTAGGVVSGIHMGKMTWVSSSLDVQLEGKGVVRFGDVCLHNGNAPNAGGQPQLGSVTPPASPAAAPSPTECALTVDVVDEAGNPVEHADVLFDGAVQGHTGRDGRVDLGSRPAGAHRLRASARGISFPERLEVLGAGTSRLVRLTVHHLPDVPVKEYAAGNARFSISAKAFVATIERTVEWMKGWAGEVVKLGASVPAATGGLLDGQLDWSGYRWMKGSARRKKFWDGAAWQPLPAGFVLTDNKYFSVGFYRSGAAYICQHGGQWPDAFTEWNLEAPAVRATIRAWQREINTKWTDQFDLRRAACSNDPKCCRYRLRTDARLVEAAAFGPKVIIFAPGNIRSNTSIWFIGDPELVMAAHEFGHYLGNPDEYVDAKSVDPSVNDDGAVNGIDPDSIMGQNMTKVKKRHLRTVAMHFSNAVAQVLRQTRAYAAVDKL